MCGIFGFVGQNAIDKTMEGIKQLEYRGYDSAGIAFMKNQENIKKNNKKLIKNAKKYEKNIKNIKNIKNNIISVRAKGEIKQLENVLNEFSFESESAIAHTRWATHGKANEVNCHPHLSQDGRWAVVHNGIIENYNELRKEIDDGWIVSETDSEVVAHLLQKYYFGNVIEAIACVCKKLRGSYALAIVFDGAEDEIYAARKNSPVVVGCSETCGVVCSDLQAMPALNEVYILENETLACVKRGKLEFFDFDLTKRNLSALDLTREDNSTSKDGYPHFMLKEIEEIPCVVQKTAFSYNNFEKLSTLFDVENLRETKNILIVGCGTAYHAGLVGGEVIERWCKIKTNCVLASELLHKEFLFDEQTLAIFVSQSGETADTLKAVALCKGKGLKTLAITNVKNSSITRECDFVLYTLAGKECAVASTKAYNAQLAVFYLFAAFLKEIRGKEGSVEECYYKLIEISKKIEGIQIDKIVQTISEEICHSQSIYMIGRGMDYFLALESALKLKEISYIHCEAYPSGELKHGTLSLIEEGSFVFAFATSKETFDKNISNAKEVSARGGKVIFISPFETEENFSKIIKVEQLESLFMPLYAVVYMQKLAYFTACRLGRNPDKPRGLAKSVTVE